MKMTSAKPVNKPTRAAKTAHSRKLASSVPIAASGASVTAAKRNRPAARSGRRMAPEAVREMFRRFQAADPTPKGELEYLNPFTLLVAVVLSAQATDAGVNKATRHLFARAETPEKMVALGEEAVREFIKTIGLFRNKAKNVIALSEALIAKHGGQVPREREALEALPGVGRKTANVVLNIAFGEPTIAVDTHLFRLANRLALAPGKTPLAVEQKLLRIIPPEYLLHAHHWLILHGRYICKALRPRCEICPIADLCTAADKVLP
ncbi:MAG: endonuclease III [Hyphomicrobiaceae bacterium]